MARYCFGSDDINGMVLTKTQGEMQNELDKSLTLLKSADDNTRLYWQDRSAAYWLAIEISKWYDKVPAIEKLEEIESRLARIETRIYNQALRNIPDKKATSEGIEL